MLKNKLVAFGLMLSLFTSIVFGEIHSRSHVKKVEKLLDDVQINEMMEKNIDVIVNHLTQEPMFAGHKKEFKELYLEIMDYKSLRKEMMTAYLNTFTEDEIDEMIKFNQSAVGQKMHKKLPEITEQLMANMHKNVEINQKKVKDLILKIALENKENQK